MDVEILSTDIRDKVVIVTGIDVSDENLRRMERLKDDAAERIIEFRFDTREKAEQKYLRNWLKRQKATRQSRTWGEALNSIVGTITTIAAKYGSWE